MGRVTRVREPAMVLLMLQALLAAPGFPEFMYDHPPSIVGVAASTVLALGWITLAAWSGWRGWRSFLALALVFWGLSITVLLLAMWAGGSDSIVRGYQAILLLILVLGPPLHGLSFFVPIENQQVRYLVAAIGTLGTTLAAYLIARWFGSRAGLATGPGSE